MPQPPYPPLVKLLRSYERAMGLQCCFRAMNDVWRQTHRAVAGRMLIHASPFCQPFRRTQLDQCIKCDSRVIYELLLQHTWPLVRTCHAGADEILIPVHWHGQPVLVAFFGQFRRTADQPDHLPLWSQAKVNHMLTLATALQSQLEKMYRDCLAELPAPSDPRLADTLAWLTANLERDPSLDDLAAFLCVSPTWASHLLRKLAGKPYSQIRDEMRVQRAQDLLTHSTLKLAGIAAKVGMRDVSYFSRFFKNKVGMPATTYRRIHRRMYDA